MTKRRVSVFRRDPLAVALVAVNLVLAGVLLHRRLSRPSALPPGHPDVAVPAGIRAEMGGGGSSAALALSGEVTLSPRLKRPWPKGAHVFVIARAAGEDAGPPFAARRYDGVRAPFAWSLGPGDEMLGGAVPPRLRVTVRVDQDGDATTRQLGDLAGGPSRPVPPAASVGLVIDREAKLAAF